MTVRAGLYGTGAFAAFLAETLRGSSALALTAIGSRTRERAEAFSQRHGIGLSFESFDLLLGRDDIDAVIIATPPADHAPKTLQALRAGKHVFVEKPIATTAEDASAVLAAAGAAKRTVTVDYPMPYTDVVAALAAVTAAAPAGALRRIDVQNIASSSGLGDDHWFWDRSVSGGIFVEHGVHFFDWCGSLLGAPRSAVAWSAQSGGRQDRVFAAIGHDEGALATYYHAFIATPQTERTRVDLAFDRCDAAVEGWIPTRLALRGPAASDAAIVVRSLRRPGLLESRVDDAIVFDAGEKLRAYAAGISALAADFAAAVTSGEHRMLVDGRRGLESLRVAAAAREAAADGEAKKL